MGTAKLIRLYKNEDLLSEIDRLHRVVNELKDKLIENQGEEKTILVTSNGITRWLQPSGIIMVKADSNYSTLSLEDGTSLLTSKTLKYWEGEIDNSDFIRVHSSYLVNKKLIVQIDHKNNEILLKGNKKAVLSKAGRQALKAINQL